MFKLPDLALAHTARNPDPLSSRHGGLASQDEALVQNITRRSLIQHGLPSLMLLSWHYEIRAGIRHASETAIL